MNACFSPKPRRRLSVYQSRDSSRSNTGRIAQKRIRRNLPVPDSTQLPPPSGASILSLLFIPSQAFSPTHPYSDQKKNPAKFSQASTSTLFTLCILSIHVNNCFSPAVFYIPVSTKAEFGEQKRNPANKTDSGENVRWYVEQAHGKLA
jgi:hypothetical protein